MRIRLIMWRQTAMSSSRYVLCFWNKSLIIIKAAVVWSKIQKQNIVKMWNNITI